MTLDPAAETFLGQMRKRGEKRAVVDHRFFTESLNFNDADAWDAQAEVETVRYLEGLDYAGHAFADDEIHGFLETFGFSELRVEQVGLEMFGVAVRIAD